MRLRMRVSIIFIESNLDDLSVLPEELMLPHDGLIGKLWRQPNNVDNIFLDDPYLTQLHALLFRSERVPTL